MLEHLASLNKAAGSIPRTQKIKVNMKSLFQWHSAVDSYNSLYLTTLGIMATAVAPDPHETKENALFIG